MSTQLTPVRARVRARPHARCSRPRSHPILTSRPTGGAPVSCNPRLCVRPDAQAPAASGSSAASNTEEGTNPPASCSLSITMPTRARGKPALHLLRIRGSCSLGIASCRCDHTAPSRMTDGSSSPWRPVNTLDPPEAGTSPTALGRAGWKDVPGPLGARHHAPGPQEWGTSGTWPRAPPHSPRAP